MSAELVSMPVQPRGLIPTNMADAMRLAEMMATAKLVPQGLQKSPADCLMVIQQAIRWEMDPFAVAQECSVIQGKLMYSGKLVAAVINSRGLLAERLSYSYEGENQTRCILVSGKLRGELSTRDVTVHIKDAKTAAKVWQTQPDQQLAYHGARVWARRHMPELMLGVWSPEEFGKDSNGDERINPHTVRPDDVVDVPPPNHPDRLPEGDPDIKPLPKKNARDDFAKMQVEMHAIKNEGELKTWGKASANRIATFPPDWQDIMRGLYTAHLATLQAKSPTQQALEESAWVIDLDNAYENCEDAAEFFAVDAERFTAVIPTVSVEAKDAAEKVRQRHVARFTET